MGRGAVATQVTSALSAASLPRRGRHRPRSPSTGAGFVPRSRVAVRPRLPQGSPGRRRRWGFRAPTANNAGRARFRRAARERVLASPAPAPPRAAGRGPSPPPRRPLAPSRPVTTHPAPGHPAACLVDHPRVGQRSAESRSTLTPCSQGRGPVVEGAPGAACPPRCRGLRAGRGVIVGGAARCRDPSRRRRSEHHPRRRAARDGFGAARTLAAGPRRPLGGGDRVAPRAAPGRTPRPTWPGAAGAAWRAG